MALVGTYEQATHTRRYALSVVDGLARVLGSRGPLPAPLGEVTCQVVEQLAPIPATFDPPLVLWTMRNATGFVILDGTYAREGARVSRLPLNPGDYRVRLSGAYYQDLEFLLQWPPAGDKVRVPADKELKPSAAYPFPAITPASFPEPNTSMVKRPYNRGFTLIRGTVFTAAGDPVRGATAEIVNLVFNPLPPPPDPPPPPWTFLTCVTGKSGDWAILLPDRLRVTNAPATTTAPVELPLTIRITSPPAAVVDVAATVPLGTEFSIRQTALRGRVTQSGRAVERAVIATSLGSESSRSRSDGGWVLYLDLNEPDASNVTVTATTPGGASQSRLSEVAHGATVVVPTFEFA